MSFPFNEISFNRNAVQPIECIKGGWAFDQESVLAFCRYDRGWRHNRQCRSDGNFDGPNDVRHLSRFISNQTKTAD